VEAETLDELVGKLEGVDAATALETLKAFNSAVDPSVPFDPTVKDGKSARGLMPPRANWAQTVDKAPFRAYPVPGGITFTYGGLTVSADGAVLTNGDMPIPGLFACGGLVHGVFFNGYPGGSGLTSGAVFGRSAGYGADALAATTRRKGCTSDAIRLSRVIQPAAHRVRFFWRC
jgi:tricarballylate dehydrogenase